MVATCGFDSRGTARVAAPGYDCRVDAQNGIWGFCPTTVINAWDCGLAGYCVDEHDCTDGCGPLKDRSDITTFTCEGKRVCSTVISDNDFGQSYLQVGCGDVAARDTIHANPPSVSATTTSSSTSSTTTNSGSSSTSSSTTSLSSEVSSSVTPPPTTPSAATETPPSLLPSLATDAQSSTTPNRSTPLGPIIGGAIGGISVVCLTVLAIFFIRHRNRRASSRHSAPPLRRLPSYSKAEIHDEPSIPSELGVQHHQYHEVSELNREPAELPGYSNNRHGSGGSK